MTLNSIQSPCRETPRLLFRAGCVLSMLVAIVASTPSDAQRQQRSTPAQREQPSPQSQRQGEGPARGERESRQADQKISVLAGFRTALEPHGRWEKHARFGEVWIPASRSRDWRPYTVGRWVYTEEWGWYWAEDREEADWGWVTYHYGRWVHDRDLGWAWLPGEEWAPAFVQWRNSDERVGWSPLPPEQIIVEYRDEPDVWVFVRVRDFAAPRLFSVLLPRREYATYVRQTALVNQTVMLDRRGVAVNPGIPATIIAAGLGRPIRTFDVRPRVFAGTAQIPAAIQVRAEDLRNRNFRSTATLTETRNTIQPSRDRSRKLEALRAGEKGRLGENPPRATQRDGQQQPGQQAEQQKRKAEQQKQAEQKQQAEQQKKLAEQKKVEQTRQADQQKRQADQKKQAADQQKNKQNARSKQEPVQTQGRAANQDRQGQQNRQQQRRDQQQREPTSTQGRRPDEQRQGRQAPSRENLGTSNREQQQRGAQQPRTEPSTVGRGGNRPQQVAPAARQSAPTTEGRGGRSGAANASQSRGRPGEQR